VYVYQGDVTETKWRHDRIETAKVRGEERQSEERGR